MVARSSGPHPEISVVCEFCQGIHCSDAYRADATPPSGARTLASTLLGEKRGILVAAAALEQSMLESKDKDTLLEMAKALGVKVTARQKKSDIIDKILETTGPSSSSTPAAEAASGNGQSAPAPSAEPARAGAEPASPTPPPTSSSDGSEVVLGPDGEPLADWEIELARSGESAEAGESTPRNEQNRGDQNRGDQNRSGQNRGERSGGDQGRGDQSRGDQNLSLIHI